MSTMAFATPRDSCVFLLHFEHWLDCVLCSECAAGTMPQLLEESSGRTVYQPSVRILKRDPAADALRSTNQ